MQTIAVVTGAGRGLGRKIADRLAARGHHVLATDIDAAAAQATATAVGGTAVAQDVRDPESHRQVARMASELGELVVWVNNAGVLAVGDAWEMADAAVQRMVEVNLLGVIWGCHAAIPRMTRGQILNIASISSLVPAPGLAIYDATKHGVLGYSLSVAGELQRVKRPITISALCPDAFASDMTGAVASDPAAALLFSAGKLLTLDAVADAAIDLVDHPRPIRTLPASRAALIHLLRPFPSLALRLLDQLAKLGRKHQR
ncbi:MAG TPA: SDR family oxidoreductase [Kofleriaceae bacterium]|nr:SDR family oxidoreductase [Kofleriaceae bacterium]